MFWVIRGIYLDLTGFFLFRISYCLVTKFSRDNEFDFAKDQRDRG